MFSKNIRTIYLYLVCLITLFMVIGGLIATIYTVSEVLFPYNYSYSYDYYDSDNYDYYNSREKEKEREEKNRRNENIRDIISSASICVVALPVYLYNWNKIEKGRAELENDESVGE